MKKLALAKIIFVKEKLCVSRVRDEMKILLFVIKQKIVMEARPRCALALNFAKSGARPNNY